MPQSAPPVSRSVVKPRSSIARIATEPLAASRVSGTSARSCMFTSVSTTWMCASIRPGISVRPPMSTRAAAAVMAVGDFLDQAVLDQDFYAVLEFVQARVKETTAGEQKQRHGAPLLSHLSACGRYRAAVACQSGFCRVRRRRRSPC